MSDFIFEKKTQGIVHGFFELNCNFFSQIVSFASRHQNTRSEKKALDRKTHQLRT